MIRYVDTFRCHFEGRRLLPNRSCDGTWAYRCQRVSSREERIALGPGRVQTAAPWRGAASSHRELPRLSGSEDACPDLMAGLVLGRDQTGRIIRTLGIRGIHRGKRVFSTKSDVARVKPKDSVQSRFAATAPCGLWVVDITHVRTSWMPTVAGTLTAITGIQLWQGFACVGFNVASTLKADSLPLQALDMAAFSTTGDLSRTRIRRVSVAMKLTPVLRTRLPHPCRGQGHVPR